MFHKVVAVLVFYQVYLIQCILLGNDLENLLPQWVCLPVQIYRSVFLSSLVSLFLILELFLAKHAFFLICSQTFSKLKFECVISLYLALMKVFIYIIKLDNIRGENFMSATCWTEVSKYFKDVRNKRERHSDQLGIFKPTNVQQTISFFWNSKYQKDFIHSDPSLNKFGSQGTAIPLVSISSRRGTAIPLVLIFGRRGDSYPSRINFGSQGGQLSLSY